MRKTFALFCTLLCALTGYSQTGSSDPSFNTADDGFHIEQQVHSLARQADGKLIVGGYLFSTRYTLARLNADGTHDSSFDPGTGADGSVNAVAVQPDGKILIGGTFSNYDGTARRAIARVNANGSLDATFAVGSGLGTSGSVYDIVLQPNGKIIVAGQFSTYNGTARSCIVRLNADGTIDATFAPGTGATGAGFPFIYDLELQPDGKVLATGDFTAYNGVTRNRLTRINTNGTIDASFNPGTGINNTGFAVALQPDGKVVVGGQFTLFNGGTANRLVRLSAAGAVDATFNAGVGPNSTVLELQLRPDGKLYAGGHFTTFSGTSRSRFALVNANGSLDATYDPGTGLDAQITSFILLPDSKLLVGGHFALYKGLQTEGLMRLNTDGTKDAAFNTLHSANKSVSQFALQPDGKILVGGFFTLWGNEQRGRIARLNSDGSLDATFATGSGFNSTTQAFALQPDGRLVVSGQFNSYNGSTANRIIRLNTDGSIDASFVTGSGFNNLPNALAIQADGKILVGGTITQYNGSAVNRLVRLNADGSLDASFTVTLDAAPYVLIPLTSGKILVGGTFTLVNGTARAKVARLNADGSLDAGFDPGSGPNNSVFKMVVQNTGKVVIGGDFTTVAGTARARIARLNDDGSLDATFNASLDQIPTALIVEPDDKIVVGGSFAAVNGSPKPNLARLNADGSTDATFNTGGSGPDNSVNAALRDAAGRILIGGNFHSYNGTGRAHIARLMSTSVTTGALSGAKCAGTEFDVPFTATGTFGAGNIFTVQLSNASGSFALPAVIGTLAGTASGTITVTIPVSTVAGPGYRIRVVASDPATTGTDNGTSFAILAQPTLSLPVGQTACAGALVPSISLGNAALSYTWTNNGPIGLASSGTGSSLPSFNAVNNGATAALATISVTGTPEAVAYVPGSGNNTVTAVSPDGTVKATINVGNSPRGVAVSANGASVYVTNFTSTNVSIISTATNTVTRSFNLGVSPWGVALSPDGSLLYAAGNGGGTVAVANINAGAINAFIPVGSQPRGIAISPDGSRVYVANYGSNSVSVINTSTNTVVATIPVGAGPEGIVVSPDGSKVLVANLDGASVSVINTSTNTVSNTLGTGTNPAGIALSADGSKAYVATMGSNSVRVFDLATLTVAANWPVAGGPRGISVSADGSKVFVATFSSNALVVLNATTGIVTASASVGSSPYSLGNFALPVGCSPVSGSFTITVNPVPAVSDPADVSACSGTNVPQPSVSGNASSYTWTNSNTAIGLAASGTGLPPAFTATNAGAADISGTVTLTPTSAAGGTAFVADYGSATVRAISLASNTVVATIAVGSSPVGVAAAPNGSRVYVAHAGATSLSVINTANNSVITTVNTTGSVLGIAVSPDGTKVYAADQNNAQLRVINAATNTVTASIATGTQPWGVAVSPDGSRVYVSNFGSDNVTVINALTNTVVMTIPIAVSAGVQGVAVTPDGTKLLVGHRNSNKVSVISTATNTIIATITVGLGPVGITILPSGSKAYVANIDAGTVSVINIATNTVSATIAGTTNAWGISCNADGSNVYVACSGPASMKTVSTATNTVTATVATGSQSTSFGNFVAQTLCTGPAQQYTITVQPLPTASISYPGSPYCATGTAMPTITGAAGGTFSAAPAGLSIDPATGAVDVAASISGTYTVTYALSSACGSSAPTATITVNVPSVTQPADVAWCSGITGALVSFTGSANTVYSWTNNNTATGLGAMGTGNITSFTGAGVASATSSTITVTPKIYDAGAGFAYVPNSGSATVSAINLATGIVTPVAVAAQPYGTVVNASGTRVYVFHNTGNNVSVINTATNAVSTIAVGAPQLSGALSPDGSRLYVTKPASNQVAVINTATNTLIQNITVGTRPWDIKASPDGSKVYVINQNSNNVSVISTATNSVIATLPFGNTSYALAISPDGSRLFVGNLVGQTVSVINTATNTLLFSIPNMGANAAGMVVSADGTRLFVSVNGIGVFVFSTATGTQLGTVSLPGAGPGISLNGDGSRVYVTNTTATGGVYAFTSDSYTYLGLTNTGNNPYGYGAWVYNPSCTGTPKQFTLTVNPTPSATLSYAGSPYCNSGTATPTFTGTTGGTFTAAPAGLSINAATGVIDVAASTEGSYTVTYTLSNSCGSTAPAAAVTISKPSADQPADIVRCAGSVGVPDPFTGSPNTVYSWTNTNTATGLAASGTGSINSFTAANVAVPTTGTITVTPRTGIAPMMYVPNLNTNRVVVLNPASGTIVASIAVGTTPQSASPLPNGSRVYVTNYGSNNVTVINTTTNTVLGTIGVGAGPHTVLPSPDGLKAFVSNMDGNSVSVINTASNTVSATIPGLSAPRGIGISPDGTRLYVTNSGNNTVAVINTATNAILTNIPIGAGTTPWNIAVSPDGSKVYCLNATSTPGVSVISTATNTVTATIAGGFTPFAGIVSPDGSKLYLTANAAFNGNSNIYQVNTATNAVTTIGGFNRPTGLALNYDGSMLYVTDNVNGRITTLNTVTNTIAGSLNGAGQTYGYGSLVYLPYCSGTPKQFTLTVNPAPSASFSYPGSPYCASGTATPTFTGTAGGTFSSTAGLSINAATGAIDVAASTSGTYTVTYSITNGCGTVSATAPITIIKPTVNTIADQSLCAGATAGPISLSGANSFTWTNSNPAVGLAASGTGFIPAFTATNGGSTPQTATITVTPTQAGTFAYLANMNSGTVTVFNTLTNSEITKINTGGSPYGVAVHPNGSTVYVSHALGGSVSAINTATNTVVATIPAAAQPYSIALCAATNRLYTLGRSNGILTVINTATNTVVTSFSIGVAGTTSGLVVNAAGTRAYASLPNTNNVVVINTATNTVLATLTVPGAPTGMVLSADGTKLYAALLGSNQVSLINTATNTVTATINVNGGPMALELSGDGSKLYVSCRNGGQVAVINTASNTVSSYVTTSISPFGLQLSPDGSKLYVAHDGGPGVLSVINTASLAVQALALTDIPNSYGRFVATTSSTCTGTPMQFNVTVNPAPSAAFSYPAASYCNTGTAVPTISSNPGGTFSAAPAGLSINPATGAVDIAASATGTYTVTYSVSNSCGTATATATITVAVPSVNTLPDATVCAGTTAGPFTFTGAASFNWTSSNPAIGLAGSGTGSIAAFTAINAGATPVTSTVTVTPVHTNTYAYVTNDQAGTVSVINTTTGALAATIPVGTNPTGVAITPNGQRVYIVNSGSGSVSVISTASNAVIATVSVGTQPYGAAVSPDGSKVYVTNYGGNTISIISTATNTVTGSIAVGTSPSSVVFNAAGTRAYVTNAGTGNVSVINAATNAFIVNIPVGNVPYYSLLSPDGTRLYVSRTGTNQVSVINTGTNTVSTTFNTFYNGPTGMDVSADGSRLFVSCTNGNSVVSINTATGALTGQATVSSPLGLQLSADGSRVYAAAGTNQLVVLNSADLSAGTPAATGGRPTALGRFLLAGPNCAGTPKTFTITVNASPTASIAYNGGPFCATGTISPVITGALGGSFSSTAGLSLNAGSGAINLAASTPGTYTVTYTIAAAGGCAAVNATASVTVQGTAVISQPADVNLCSGSLATPVVFSGSNGSGFTWTNSNPAIGLPAGGTGNLPAFSAAMTATPLTATITVNMTAQPGFCAAAPKAFTITVSPGNGAAFSYAGGTFCTTGSAAPIPQAGYTAGGTYSAGPGMSINAATGVIDLANTVPGLYTVTYNVPANGSCAAAQGSAIVQVNAPASASIAYGAMPLCGSAAPVAVTRTGTTGGVYSAAPAGLSINPATGTITPASSTPGTYTVTYFVAAGSSQCPDFSTTTTVTISAALNASISYSGSPYCGGTGMATPTRTGTAGGTYSGTAGLSINAASGNIDLAASTPGSYTVTYSIPASGSCAAVNATAAVTIVAAPAVTQPADVTACAGTVVPAIPFSGSATSYAWTNSNPAIGLPASGSGNIPAFTAGATAQTATITVTPQQAAGASYAYVPNFGSNNVSVVNTATNAVVATIPVGAGPWGITAAPNGSRVYVINKNAGTVSAINTATNTVAATINVGTNPIGACVSPDGSRLYVVNNGDATVSVINTATNAVISTFGMPNGPYDIRISPDGSKLYIGNSGNGFITVVNPANNATIASFNVGGNTGLALSPDGSRLYVANNSANQVAVVNTVTNSVIGTVPVGLNPIMLAVTPDGGRVYVTSPNANNVSVINTATNTVVATIAAGASPWGLSITPDGSTVYVTNNGTNSVSVISTGSNTVMATVPVGTTPLGFGTFITGGSGSCAGTPKTFTITVNPAPAATISYSGSPYCAGGTAMPVITGTTGGSFSAPAGMSIDAATGAINLAATTPGTYTVSYTLAAAGGCNAVVATASVTVMGTAVITQPSNLSVCGGSTVNPAVFSGTNGSGFSWTNSNPAIGLGTSGLGNLPAFTAAATGSSVTATITVSMNAAPGFCPAAPKAFIITISPAPAAVFGYSSATFCASGTATPVLQAGTQAGGTFSAGAGMSINPATGVIDLAATAPGSYTVTYSVPASGSCAAAQGTASVLVNAPLSAGIAYGGAPYCGSGSAAVTLTGSTGGTFSAPAGLSINAATGLIDLASSVAGSYTVTYALGANGACPAFSTTASVTIGAAQSATISYAGSPYCNSGTATVTQTGTPGGSYSAPAGLSLDASTGAVNLSASTPGTYTVTYTAVGNGVCAPATATATITVSAAPAAVISYPASPYCSNAGTIAVQRTGTAGGTFSAPAGLAINAATGQIDPAASVAGSYTVTYTVAAGGGCPAFSTTASIVITPMPGATISYAGTPFCGNSGTAAVSFSGTTGGTYSSSPGLSIDAATGVINLSASIAGTYPVTYSLPATGGCASFSTSTTVTISMAPAASFSYAGSPYCGGSGTAIPALTGTTGGAFSASAGLTIDAATGIIDLAASTPGTYTVAYTVAAANGCAAFSSSAPVTITAPASASITYNGTPFCGNAGTALPTLAGTMGGTYSSTAGLSIDAATGAINPGASTPGSYVVRYTIAANGGCALFSTTTPVTIAAPPAATIAYGGSPYCGSGTATVTLTGTTGGVFSAPAGLSINAGTGAVDLASSTPGNYTVTYTLSVAGCAPVSSTAGISILAAPTASISYTAPAFCANGGTVTVTRTGSAGGTYSASPGGLSIDAVTGAIDASASAPGNYTVTYAIAASGACGAFSTTTTVSITAVPSATIAYNGSPFCSGSGTVAVSLSGTPGGTFSAGAGLSINPATGAINLAASTAGTYTVTYSVAAAGGCATYSTGTSVSVGLTPTAGIAYTGTPYCANGGTAAPALTGATGGAFSGTAGLAVNPTTGVVDLAASATGAHTVTYTVSGTGTCPAFSTTASLQINPAPAAAITYGAAAWCSSAGSITVARTGSAGGSFTATPAGLAIDAATGTVDAGTSTPGNYTVTYTVPAANGCAVFSTNTSITITVQPAATITYGGTPYCSNGGTAAVSRTGTAGGTFSSTAGLSIDAVTGLVNLGASTPGNYLVTYTVAAGSGCGAISSTTLLSISAAPSASISYGAPAFCSNGGMVAVSRTGTGGGNYTAAPAGLVIDPATGAINAGASAAGNYTVTYTVAAANGCAAFSTTASVQITALPTSTISYGAPFCTTGTPVMVTRTGTAGGTFAASPAGLVINPATGTIDAAASTAGTYTVTYTIAAAGGCAPVSTSTTVTVTAAPTAAIAYNAPLCTTGGNVTPTLTGATGGLFSATPAGLSIDPATGIINAAASTAGSYTVSYTLAPAGGCALFATTATVVVNAAPAATISYSGSPFCGASGTVTVTHSGTPGGTYSGTPGLSIDAATGTVNLGASAPGTHTVTYTVAPANGCAIFSTTATVVIRIPATVNPIASAAYCAGDPTAVTTFVGTGTNYSWTNSNPGIGLPASGTGDIPAFTTLNARSTPLTATITVTPDDNGCAGTPRSFTITVNPLPAATLTATGSTQLCPGTPLYLLAAGGTGYQWFRNGTAVAGLISPLIDAQEPGSYNVRVTTSAGCTAMAPTPIRVTQIAAPVPAFTVSGTCLGAPTQFTNNTNPAGNPAVNYRWDFGDGTTGAQISPSHVYSRPGSVRVTLRAWVPGCEAASGTATELLRIEQALQGIRLPSENVLSATPQVLRARPLPGADYSWSPAGPLSNANTATPTVSLTTSTEFLIRMTLPSGCQVTDTLLVRAFIKNDILVPDAFTPNGDGRNDVLRALPVGIRTFGHFRIFSRSGELVFETTDPARGWDGRYKGFDMGTATFVWIADGIDRDGQPVVRKGTVTLIR